MKSLKLLLLVFCLVGCSREHITFSGRFANEEAAIFSLANSLILLNNNKAPFSAEVVKKEAHLIAKRLVAATYQTNKTFRMTTGPNWHNHLIKLGLRQKGYCYHWTAALLEALPQRRLQVFERHWAVAYKRFDENNAVILTKRGDPLASGLVYDAWRGAGKPYWKKVSEDKKYRWQQRFNESEILLKEAKVEPK